MPVKTNNKDCRPLVKSRTDFEGHQLYGKTLKNDVFVVYSYGPHFPMFAYVNGKWYSHGEKASSSTSRQHGQSHPLGDVVELADVAAMKRLIDEATR